jgi:hypothetical protein
MIDALTDSMRQLGEPLNQAMLLGFAQPPTAAELDRWATTSVRTCPAAFRA